MSESAMETLLSTRAGLALARSAWQEGASTMLRTVNEHEGGEWSKPENPYSAPLLAMMRDAGQAVVTGDGSS